MKKEKLRKKIMEKIATRAAKEEANTVCPLITYQPIQPESVKNYVKDSKYIKKTDKVMEGLKTFFHLKWGI